MLIWDGYGLQSTHSGIGRHALELATELTKLGRPPTIIPSVSRLDPAFERWKSPQSHFPLSRLKPLALLAAGYQAKALARGQANKKHVFHALSNYNLPSLPRNFRNVLTVHDLIPFIRPEGVSRSLHTYLSHQMPKALRRADAIICVSEWTATCVIDQFPEFKERVRVIPNGRPERVERKKRDSAEKIRLFTVSRGETYKRLDLIPMIASALSDKFEWHVLTDLRGEQSVSSVDKIRVHRSVSDDVLAGLWKNTDIFIHPSLWEGYCLPAVSALSHGIPAVYTGGSGIDEVSGNAGIRLKPNDTADAWISAIEELATQLEAYHELCLEQWTRLMDWSEVAEQHKRLYAMISQ